MNFDLRLPIGILFGFYGVVLVLFGALGNKEIYQRSLGVNINLIWGAVLLLFGLMMLVLAWRSVRKDRPPNQVGK